jgi:oxygen-independent coproporphyrinogen-3 oxidase
MHTGVDADSDRGPVRHLYVHVPFCRHHCGYCDFVTAVGRLSEHSGYVDALLVELGREEHLLRSDTLDTVFLGGGTPTFLESDTLARLLRSLPPGREVTVEANPETITPELCEVLLAHGVTRVSLGAQTFQPELLATLERQATPEIVTGAFTTLRQSGMANLSLDLIYGIPGQRTEQLEHDVRVALELAPEHVSVYELEAKPGTRFTMAHGAELTRQSDQLENYMELATQGLQAGGYRWYETANFCLTQEGDARDLRSDHNLAYWRGKDYLGLGVGAVSTVGEQRWKNAASVSGYVSALANGEPPVRSNEHVNERLRMWERAMLCLRLDDFLEEDVFSDVLDPQGVERMAVRGLLERDGRSIRLTPRGRLLGNAVTIEVLGEPGELGGSDSATCR